MASASIGNAWLDMPPRNTSNSLAQAVAMTSCDMHIGSSHRHKYRETGRSQTLRSEGLPVL